VSSDVLKDISDSIEDVSDLLSSYDALLFAVKQREPDKVGLAALGAVLHSFYNGIEGIFLLVAKQIDNGAPSDSAWHRTLVKQMMEKTSRRNSFISAEAVERLKPYMDFRHFFRHAYSFTLDWQRMKPLALDIEATWNSVKRELISFCSII